MAVVLGNATGASSGTTSTSVVHTTGTGTEICIFVLIGMDNRNDVGVVPTVTCTPSLAVTNIASLNNIDTSSGSEKDSFFCYYITGASASTAYTIGMTQSAARGTELIAVDFSGVDQTTPYDGGSLINDVAGTAVSVTPSVATAIDGFSVAIAGGYKGSAVSASTGVLQFQGGNGSHASGVSTSVGNGSAQAHTFSVTAGGGINGGTVFNVVAGAPPGTVVAITNVLSTSSVGSIAPQLASITHVFKNETNSAFWGDGVNVTAFKSATLSTTPVILGNDVIAGGLGSVTIGLTENVDVTLVPDHLDAGAPTGEQGITSSLTPI